MIMSGLSATETSGFRASDVWTSALQDEPLAKYTSARIGGPADWLLIAHSRGMLAAAVQAARARRIPWRVIGSGSNILVADAGVRGLVIVNKARQIQFGQERVLAESGANLSSLARSCIRRGLAGLEWAVSVPGTVGGAVVGNAGAHGSDMAAVLESATILEAQRLPTDVGQDVEDTVAEWPVARLAYGYRDSALKRQTREGKMTRVVLAATLNLASGDPEDLARQADTFVAHRKRTQPPGASMGSMFKNPPGDYAGRLIDAAELKGTRVGGAQISPVHANFIINTGEATAADVKGLLDLAQKRVSERFGVQLELEIELVGEWSV